MAAIYVLLVAGCGGTVSAPATPSQGEVVVFAASSLQDAFGEMAKGVHTKVTYSFGGSQALVTQLSQGAKADVFASADVKNMQAAIAAGMVVSGTERAFVTNKLVVVTAPGSTNLATLADLGQPGLKLVLAGQSVPAGNYSLQVLDKLSADPAYGPGFKERVLANVVSRENNVRQVLAKVQLGEADAGIVYATDAHAAQSGVGSIEIPGEYNVVATYYIAPLKDAAHPQTADLFIEYTLSTEGQGVLRGYGFGSPPPGGR